MSSRSDYVYQSPAVPIGIVPNILTIDHQHLPKRSSAKCCDHVDPIIDDRPAAIAQYVPSDKIVSARARRTAEASARTAVMSTSTVEIEEAQLAEATRKTENGIWNVVGALTPEYAEQTRAIKSREVNFTRMVVPPTSITLHQDQPLDGADDDDDDVGSAPSVRVVAATYNGKPCVAKISPLGKKVGGRPLEVDWLTDVLFRLKAVSQHRFHEDTTDVHGISLTESHLVILYEGADLDLRKYLQQCNGAYIDFARLLTMKVVSLVARLQESLGYVGDVKLSNFLVHFPASSSAASSDIRLSIADAGCPFNALHRVTPPFAAPEFFAARARPDNNTTFGKRLDVYYLGRVPLAICLCLISGAPFPFVRFITESPALALSFGGDANNPFHCCVKNDLLGELLPRSVIDILKGCFESDPEKRLTVIQLENKLRDVDWNSHSMSCFTNSFYTRHSFVLAIVEHHQRNAAEEMKMCPNHELAALKKKRCRLANMYYLLRGE